MPTFATGNPSWDQGLGSLAGALFPDASKIAQAGYYGAETRKAQLGSNQLEDQQAARNSLGNLLAFGGPTAVPSAPNTVVQPAGPPGAPPILGGGLPMPGAAPPPGVGVAPSGGVIPAPPNIPPEQLAHIIAPNNGTAPQGGVGTSGQAPAMSSPGPGAPPAPNTTGSDGSVPPNDPGSGFLHPGSVTPPDGGRKMSGPAAANGSPAPVAFDLPQVIAQAARAGYDAASVAHIATGYIVAAYKRGIIDRQTMSEMLTAEGSPTIYSEDAATGRNAADNRTRITTTGMTIGGENYRQGMVTGETAREFNSKSAGTYLDTETGQPASPTQAQYQAHPEKYQPITGLNTPSNVTDNTTGQTVAMTPLQMQRENARTPGRYGITNPQVQSEDNALVNASDPARPGRIIPTTKGQAVRNGWTILPSSTDQAAAQGAGTVREATLNQTPPGQTTPETISEAVRAGTSVTAPRAPVTADESYKVLGGLLDTESARLFPPIAGQYGTREEAAILPPEARDTAIQRIEHLRQTQGTRFDPLAATQSVLSDMQKAGEIPTTLDRTSRWGAALGRSDPRVIAGGTDARGNPLPARFQIPYTPGGTGLAKTIAPTTPKPTAPASTPKPPTTAATTTLPPGALGVAPPGAAEGQTATNPATGQRAVVRGGFLYPVSGGPRS